MINMNPVVQVNVSIGTTSVSSSVFDVGAILTSTAGTGTPLTKTSRFAMYKSLEEVAEGVETVKPAFADTTDVYKAASKFFGATPIPSRFVVIFYETNPDAPAYDSAATYSVGDYCTYSAKIYRCTTAIATPEEWNAEHWAEVTPTTDTPTIALADAVDKGAEFYGVFYSPKSGETASTTKTTLASITSALSSMNNGVLFYGVTGTIEDVVGNDGILKAMHNSGTKRAIGMFCTAEENDAVALMGVAMGYGRNARGSAFAMCYKSLPTATVNNITQANVEQIKALNGNVYVARTKSRSGFENGAVASGLRYDDVLYLDMITRDIQNNLYAMIADNPTKLPQNDTTSTLFVSEINRVLEEYYNIGVLADAVWRGVVYNGMEEGATITHGYYVMVDSFDTQSAEDRRLHKAMPITVLLCLAGSVESIVINLDVQI